MRVYKYKIGDIVRINSNAESGIPYRVGDMAEIYQQLTSGTYDYQVRFEDGSKIKVHEHELGRLEKETDSVNQSQGKFEKIAIELGKFTDDKNQQYGSSVDATYGMMNVLMERYTYDEEHYLIPKSLVKHMLLQVRMMDKINRIFNNPSGKDEKESPYRDLTGYSLIGVDMVESNNS